MTVEGLKLLLSKYPGDMLVAIESSTGEYCPCASIVPSTRQINEISFHWSKVKKTVASGECLVLVDGVEETGEPI